MAIARAPASQSPVIPADEPTGNLDKTSAQEITAILKEAEKKHDRCVIIVPHSGEVAKEADMVITLKGGMYFLNKVKERSITMPALSSEAFAQYTPPCPCLFPRTAGQADVPARLYDST